MRMKTPHIHRLLTVDDNPAIHEDFRKIFSEPSQAEGALDALTSSLFGASGVPSQSESFELDSAHQGQEGFEMVKAALAAGRPYSLAFVDVRMPPGWDGIETIEQLWKVDPDLQVVICTAYSDYSWDAMRARLGESDSLVVLKKPFDTVEVLQITHALTRKWELTREARIRMEDLDRAVAERTHELQLANERLQAEMAERAKTEEVLRQAQKMEAIGQLAAGVAHDFNNLLTVIQGQAGLLLNRKDILAPTVEPLKQVMFAAERAAGLTRELLLFSRKQVPRPKAIDLNALIERTSKLLGRVIGEHIELRLVRADKLPAVTADECNLDQVIMNLAVNARDAMPHGGVLTFATSLEKIDAHAARRHPQARPGDFVCLTVTDTGCGMDSATLARVFEPFFTTKEIGKGTGLGLATVYGVVQQHQGWIDVTSQPGKGTSFRIFLSASVNAAVTPGQTEFLFRSSADNQAPATILVVEDEDAVRLYARTVLSSQSFKILEAADGIEALKVWAENDGRIDLLFTDMVMPNGMTGRALAERFHLENPNLKVVCTSGYSAEALGGSWLQAPQFRFLPKPYKPQQLLEAVISHLGPDRKELLAP